MSRVSPSQSPPRGRTILGLVLSKAKVAGGYRVTLAPAKRQLSDGQFVAIPGRARVSYVIPASLVLDGGASLGGAIEVTVDGQHVTALAIVGG